MAALFYATMARHLTPHDQVWDVALLVICLSLVIHGVTATPFTWWYARREQAEAEKGPPRW